MSADLPPLGGHAPPLQCNRLTDGTFEQPIYCGKPATWHVIWTADCENGLCCDDHAQEAIDRWTFVGFHPYDMACSMPGAVWLPDEDRCVVDEGLLGLSTSTMAVSGVL